MPVEVTSTDKLIDTWSHVDNVVGKLPHRGRLEVENITKGLSPWGARKIARKGPGMEALEPRDYHPDRDEIKDINPRMTARVQRPIVVDREAEVRQHFYLWRKGGNTNERTSMDYSSRPGELFTKREAAEIMLLAFAKHLARNDELIGFLDKKGTYTGGRAPGNMAYHLQDVNIISSATPTLHRKLPRYSTVVLFSDFFDPAEDIVRMLSDLNGQDLRGFMVMTVDPQELAFNMYKGNLEFEGLKGIASRRFGKAESIQDEVVTKMGKYITWLEKLARKKGYEFILQPTNQPLSDALLQIYGLKPNRWDHQLHREHG